LLARGSLVNDEPAAIVRQRPGDRKLSSFPETGEVLAVGRPNLGNFGLVLQILDDGGKLHDRLGGGRFVDVDESGSATTIQSLRSVSPFGQSAAGSSMSTLTTEQKGDIACLK